MDERLSLPPEGEVCMVCGHKGMVDAYPIHDKKYPDYEIHLLKCKKCGLGHTYFPHPDRRPKDEYSEDYYSYSAAGYSRTHILLKQIFYKHIPYVFLDTFMKRWMTKIPPCRCGRVLDIGCGCGVSLDTWKMLGWETYGTEIRQKPIDICLAKGHKVVSADAAERAFEANAFDWVVLDNLVEHLENPRALLRWAAKLLKADGRMTIIVPNFGGGDSVLAQGYWGALLPNQHCYHYTRNSIERLLTDCGMAVRKITFQPRFESGSSLRNARPNMRDDQFAVFRKTLRRFDAMKRLRLLCGWQPSENDGFFMTVEAEPIRH